jgi:hypothetical protein
LAKPNYQFEKRQRDLEKKKKKEEKAQRKLTKNPDGSTDESGSPAESSDVTPPTAAG